MKTVSWTLVPSLLPCDAPPRLLGAHIKLKLHGLPHVGTTASDAVPQPKPDEPHAAHAAPGSLEAVMEAQNALLTERQQQPQLAVSQEELQTQRRKSVTMCTDYCLSGLSGFAIPENLTVCQPDCKRLWLRLVHPEMGICMFVLITVLSCSMCIHLIGSKSQYQLLVCTDVHACMWQS